jgi:hypothetical protein
MQHPILSSSLSLFWIVVVLGCGAAAWVAVRRYLLR